MFTGQYEHSLDEKNRVAIPSKLRRPFKEGVVITKGLDGCLFLFTKSKWEKMAKSVGQLPTTKSSARIYARLLLASAVETNFDNQGRVTIPSYLMDYAGLSSKAVITGLYDRVEIWDKKSWDKLSERLDKGAGEIVEELSDLNI